MEDNIMDKFNNDKYYDDVIVDMLYSNYSS